MIFNRWTAALLGVLFSFLVSNPAATAQDIDHWETVIIPGRQCRYLVPDGPVDPAWTTNGFDDSGWTMGTGGVGYGDEDDNTIIDPAISVYCRYHFTLSNPDIISQLLLDMDFDDAFVAYLNGVELARQNLGEPGISPTWDQPASALQEALLYQGQIPMRFPLDPFISDLLVAGDNIFALEVHNESLLPPI